MTMTTCGPQRYLVLAGIAHTITAVLPAIVILCILPHDTPDSRIAWRVIIGLILAGYAALLLDLCGASWNILPVAMRRMWFRWLFPAAAVAGRVGGMSRDRVAASYLALSNRLSTAGIRGGEAARLLVLLPRCLQNGECQARVIEDVAMCRRCGRCDIAGLVSLKETHRVQMAVVTGGSLARELVNRLSPSAVIAIACERELVDGLRAITSLPVVCIANSRPEGPCRNTRVDIEEFRGALRALGLKGE
ncbi:MAG: DUF116 domain-containing protein [Candidatus Aureabacteria bacterium]|nr:DUF116 domain-containing protein [Candidatus Auribacterota bacterium]